ncbi:phytanoyl-CoA dioxygenase family protein [Microlunatus speluncae]|uniref:phytanoyl-CoA dioxygenase family protein n=1 Tax=Microlunatus speluncae TaxID=2594267 RepID=UPI001C2D38E0|nr:phytanoyl-CoA dioxygenase family protein [Microlunatus speluncae]
MAEVRTKFEEQGFAVIRNVLDPVTIEELQRHVQWLASRYPELRPEHWHHPLARNDAFWVRIISDDRLLDIAEAFLGPDLACFTAHYVCKRPRDGQAVLWHQDGAYWNLDPMSALTVWIAVDKCTVDNGCLRMVPGSHRMPLRAPVLRSDVPNMLSSATENEIVQDWIERAGVVDVELEPGDVEIHHPNILHSSNANTSTTRRCGLDLGYIATSTSISNEGLYLDPILCRGATVPGINRYRKYPEYNDEESIAFQGSDSWNDLIKQFNDNPSLVSGSAEEPLELTKRMIRRLADGTVKRRD